MTVSLGGRQILHGADITVEAGAARRDRRAQRRGQVDLRADRLRPAETGGAAASRWSGVEIGALRGRTLAQLRAFVPQRARVPEGVTVREAVRIGRSPHVKPLGRLLRSDHDAVERAMARAGVEQFADRALTTLSGGELQRVQIAVGLAQEAPVLMADEPTSHLDLGATATLAKLLRGLTADGLAVVLVVHDLSLAAAVADTVRRDRRRPLGRDRPAAGGVRGRASPRRLARRRRARAAATTATPPSTSRGWGGEARQRLPAWTPSVRSTSNSSHPKPRIPRRKDVTGEMMTLPPRALAALPPSRSAGAAALAPVAAGRRDARLDDHQRSYDTTRPPVRSAPGWLATRAPLAEAPRRRGDARAGPDVSLTPARPAPYAAVDMESSQHEWRARLTEKPRGRDALRRHLTFFSPAPPATRPRLHDLAQQPRLVLDAGGTTGHLYARGVTSQAPGT